MKNIIGLTRNKVCVECVGFHRKTSVQNFHFNLEMGLKRLNAIFCEYTQNKRAFELCANKFKSSLYGNNFYTIFTYSRGVLNHYVTSETSRQSRNEIIKQQTHAHTYAHCVSKKLTLH